MQIISRKEAKAKGLKRYFTGKPCVRGHIAERRTDNSDCQLCRPQMFAAWYSANIDACRKRALVKYYENIDERRAYSLAQYHSDPDTARHKNRKWRRENPEKAKAISLRRKARLKKVGGTLTASELVEIMEIQKAKCANCGTCLKKSYHADHIMPIARGGKNERNNIQLLCPPCNQSKHAKHPIDWALENGRLV